MNSRQQRYRHRRRWYRASRHHETSHWSLFGEDIIASRVVLYIPYWFLVFDANEMIVFVLRLYWMLNANDVTMCSVCLFLHGVTNSFVCDRAFSSTVTFSRLILFWWDRFDGRVFSLSSRSQLVQFLRQSIWSLKWEEFLAVGARDTKDAYRDYLVSQWREPKIFWWWMYTVSERRSGKPNEQVRISFT